jgi:hypothetical protein
MAFRECTNGPELWPRCCELQVAAIEYGPIDDIDFSPYAHREQFPVTVQQRWSQLAPAQKASFRRFLWEMTEKDVIYVKQGPMIVGKGVVTGPYQFDKNNRIEGPQGVYWQHQRSVNWIPDFPAVSVQVGRSQQFALESLTSQDIERVEDAVGRRISAGPQRPTDRTDR